MRWPTRRKENSAGIGGHWYVLAAAVLWGTTGTAQAFAPDGASPESIGALRLLIGGLALLALVSVRHRLRWTGGLAVWPTFVAAAAVAAYQLTFFAGVARTGVAVGTIVAIGSAPILAGLLGWLFRGERPGRGWLLATGFAIAGCALLVAAGRTLSVNVNGMLLALLAGLSYAVYAVSSKHLFVGRHPEQATAVVFSLGAIILLPVLLVSDLGWLLQPGGLAVVLHLGLVATAAAYFLFGRGLALIPIATAVTLSLAEPLTAATLGVMVLGERLSVAATAGAGLLLAGLALLSIRRQ